MAKDRSRSGSYYATHPFYEISDTDLAHALASRWTELTEDEKQNLRDLRERLDAGFPEGTFHHRVKMNRAADRLKVTMTQIWEARGRAAPRKRKRKRKR